MGSLDSRLVKAARTLCEFLFFSFRLCLALAPASWPSPAWVPNVGRIQSEVYLQVKRQTQGGAQRKEAAFHPWVAPSMKRCAAEYSRMHLQARFRHPKQRVPYSSTCSETCYDRLARGHCCVGRLDSWRTGL